MMNGRAVVGVVLLLFGVAFGVAGYDRMQPNGLEKTIEFAASVAGEPVPRSLQRDKSDAYLLLAAGTGLFVGGIGLLVRRPN